jgi:hypothetical protein
MSNLIEKGMLVNFKSKGKEMTGKVVKIYEDKNGNTYHKISSEKKYYFKQLKDVQVSI